MCHKQADSTGDMAKIVPYWGGENKYTMLNQSVRLTYTAATFSPLIPIILTGSGQFILLSRTVPGSNKMNCPAPLPTRNTSRLTLC